MLQKLILAAFLLLVFLLPSSCYKAENILKISKHKWIVAANSPNGILGSSYHFLDNRLFFYERPGQTKEEGKWSFSSRDCKEVSIQSNYLSFDYFTIDVLSDSELKINVLSSFISPSVQQIYLIPAN